MSGSTCIGMHVKNEPCSIFKKSTRLVIAATSYLKEIWIRVSGPSESNAMHIFSTQNLEIHVIDIHV